MNDLVSLAAIAALAYVGYRLYRKYKPCCSGCASGATCGGSAPSTNTQPSTVGTFDVYESARPIGLDVEYGAGSFTQQDARKACA